MEEKEEKVEFEENEEEQPKKVQTREENAYYAEQRRKQQKTYRDGLREGLKTNPFTGDTMNDDYDLEVYEVMKELNEQGKDPLKDYPRYMAMKSKEESNKKKKEEEEKKSIEKDISKFVEDFPQVDLKTLYSNEDFKDYADGKWGNKSLSEIYKGYLRLAKKNETEKKKVSTPSSQSSGESVPKSIKSMTDEEVHKLFAEKYGKYS